MANVIPDTDDPYVAAVAAALHVITVRQQQQQPYMATKEMLEHFVDAYEVIATAMKIEHDCDEARARLEKVK